MNNASVKELLNALGAMAEMSLSCNRCWCNRRRIFCSIEVFHFCLHSW